MTSDQMAKCFNEWMRRFIDEPERFAHEFEAVRSFLTDESAGREPSYGEQCAAYMRELLQGE